MEEGRVNKIGNACCALPRQGIEWGSSSFGVDVVYWTRYVIFQIKILSSSFLLFVNHVNYSMDTIPILLEFGFCINSAWHVLSIIYFSRSIQSVILLSVRLFFANLVNHCLKYERKFIIVDDNAYMNHYGCNSKSWNMKCQTMLLNLLRYFNRTIVVSLNRYYFFFKLILILMGKPLCS